MGRLTVSQVKADESIPREFIRQLDTLRTVDDTPLSKWTREMFEVGRRLGFQDNIIMAILKANAKDRGYLNRTIRRGIRNLSNL
jgi:aminoglycoside phosphotransferase (APT) family kinase protein